MRKIKNKESIDEISQGLIIKQRKTKIIAVKKITNCSSRNRTKQNKRKTKVKLEIKIETKPPNHQKKKKLKHHNDKEKMKLMLMKEVKSQKNEENDQKNFP